MGGESGCGGFYGKRHVHHFVSLATTAPCNVQELHIYTPSIKIHIYAYYIFLLRHSTEREDFPCKSWAGICKIFDKVNESSMYVPAIGCCKWLVICSFPHTILHSTYLNG